MLIWMQWRHVRSFFSCLEGDVTGAGKDVKRHCPRLSEELSDAFSSTETRTLFDGVCRHIAASRVKPRVSNVGAWPVHGWIEVDQPVASVMPSLESDVNEHGTVTWRDFTAYTLLLLIALICPSCFIQTQACCGAHHPKPTALTNAHDCHAMMVNFT